MTATPDWLPSLIALADHDHSWDKYISFVYSVFHRDFVETQPQFRGGWVRSRRDPLYDGKEAGFWHCVQEGADEEQRTPDLRRCERIGWIRAILENGSEVAIDQWQSDKRGDRRQYLWFDEQYLVVLGNRGQRKWQLITAFCTDRNHTIRKLRRERDESTND